MKYADGGLLKIAVIAGLDIHEFLWVAVCQRKPAALNLYHDAMPFYKSMRHIGQLEFHAFCFIGFECFGCRIAVPVTATHDLSTHQHLITTHGIGAAGITGVVAV